MSLRRDESADHVIRTSIGWYEAGALSLTANSKKICPPQWYRLAAAVLLQHAVILFILLPNAHLLTIGCRPEFTTVIQQNNVKNIIIPKEIQIFIQCY